MVVWWRVRACSSTTVTTHPEHAPLPWGLCLREAAAHAPQKHIHDCNGPQWRPWRSCCCCARAPEARRWPVAADNRGWAPTTICVCVCPGPWGPLELAPPDAECHPCVSWHTLSGMYTGLFNTYLKVILCMYVCRWMQKQDIVDLRIHVCESDMN